MPSPDPVDYVILLLMAAVLAVLLAGVVQMFSGRDPRKSNRLMVWRVTLQGLVVLLLVAFLARG